MDKPLILHYAPDNASLCVRLALLERGVPFTTALVNRETREQHGPSFRALNPNGLIPALEAPHGPMFETAAILLWLADREPGTLFPAPDSNERALALSWFFWAANTLHPTLRMLFYPDHYAPAYPGVLHDATRDRLHQQLSLLDAHWSAQPQLLHCYIAPMIRWCALYSGDTAWFDLSRYPSLQAFAQSFETTPAAIAAAKAEGLGPTPFSRPSRPTPPEGSAT